MTELQISLIIIGAVIIVGVIAYNKWQEYRAHRTVERAFSDGPEDILMKAAQTSEPEDRKEPVFFQNTVPGVKLTEPDLDVTMSINGVSRDDVTETFDAEATMSAGFAESEMRETAEPDDAGTAVSDSTAEEPLAGESTQPQPDVVTVEVEPAVPAAAQPQRLPVDELIDYGILLELEKPVRGEKLLRLVQTLRYTGNKPVHFIGLHRNEETGEESWQVLLHGGSYQQLKAGVQLANRTGPLNEIEYSELITRLRQLADEVGAEPVVPDMADVLQVGRQLYQFVSEHDARLGINVRASGAPWSVRTVVSVLERHKLDLRPDGFFVMHDTDGSVLFSVTLNMSPGSETATHLTLLLDVPCVTQEKHGFEQMVRFARTLCQRLGGILVDDDDRMLSEPMISDIMGQVNVFYDEMKAMAIPAGSVRAMRLFN